MIMEYILDRRRRAAMPRLVMVTYAYHVNVALDSHVKVHHDVQ